MATIAERMKVAMDFRNMKQAELVSMTGIGKSSISTYLSGEYKPKQKNIYKIAKALSVNEAWLMGEDVPMERLDWESLINSMADRNKAINDVVDLLIKGVSYEGEHHEYLIFKCDAPNDKMNEDVRSTLLRILHTVENGREEAMRTVRILAEIASSLDKNRQAQLIAFAEFLDVEHQREVGTNLLHPYQQKK